MEIFFNLLTPIIYWSIAIIWGVIFVFYINKIKNFKSFKLLKLLLVIYEQFNQGVTENERVNFESQKLKFGYYFTSKNNRNAWGAQAGITHQEITFDQGNFFWIYALGVSWELKFK